MVILRPRRVDQDSASGGGRQGKGLLWKPEQRSPPEGQEVDIYGRTTEEAVGNRGLTHGVSFLP